MPITSAHRVPRRQNPHCTHSDEPRDSRGAGFLAKLPRVALARNHDLTPAPAPRADISTERVLLTAKMQCCGRLDVGRCHTEFVAEVA